MDYFSLGLIVAALMWSVNHQPLVASPVRQKSTDEILCVVGNVAVVWEGQGVLVVHNFAVSPNERVGVEGSVTCAPERTQNPIMLSVYVLTRESDLIFKKNNLPTSISNRKTPTDHQSHSRP